VHASQDIWTVGHCGVVYLFILCKSSTYVYIIFTPTTNTQPPQKKNREARKEKSESEKSEKQEEPRKAKIEREKK